MDMIKIIRQQDIGDLTQYASDSYEANAMIIIFTTIITLLLLDDMRKQKYHMVIFVIRFIKLFIIAYLSVYVLFMGIDNKFNKQSVVTLNNVFKWMVKPMKSYYDKETKKMYILPIFIFDKRFYMVELGLRMYLASFVVVQFLNIIRHEMNITNPTIEFLVYFVLNVVIIGLVLTSIYYINHKTAYCLIPLSLSLTILTIDRFVLLLHEKTNTTINMKAHKKGVNAFKDIFYNIKCRKNNYGIYLNNNFVFTITSLLFFLNISYQLYNI